ncbi:DUF309 domain-containing protein [Ureibacillus sp. FSL W8-0352]|uniref:DUF309 domain-containing protein n=1 Tax=Ureibacillus sp. FSL W8-0352 TaxID=2954596 RepID=UPI0030F4BA89
MHPLFHPLFIDFCAYFNGNQDYFECHEVLEEYWKTIAPGKKEHPLVGYIQLATGLYHWRRGNLPGAHRIMRKAYKKFLSNQGHPFFDYIDFQQLCNDCLKSIDAIENNQSYKAFQIKLMNRDLIEKVNGKISSLPPLSHEFLLHKHMLRDRSDILTMREEKRNGRR